MLERCIELNFGPQLLNTISDSNEKALLLNLFKMVVFCHRHNKNDSFLQEVPLDFEIVRDPMYKYSRTAQNRFFAVPTLAFMFAHFAKN